MIVIENEFMEHPDITLIPNDVSPEEASKYAKMVKYPIDMPLKEAIEYVRYFEIKYPQYTNKSGIISLKIINKEEIDLDFFEDRNVPFERIRRITGYLVGTIDRWNNGKTAELKDRVKHDTSFER